MTNNLVLPLLALILAILAALFPFRREDQATAVLRQRVREIRSGAIVTAVVVLLFTGAVLIWPSIFTSGSAIALAVAIGALVSCFAAGADASQGAYAFGLAVTGAAILHLDIFPAAAIAKAQIAFLTGTFVAAFAIGGLRTKGSAGYLCSLSAVLVVAVDFLGRMAVGSEPASATGTVLGLALLVSAIIAGVARRFSKGAVIPYSLGFLALAVLGYLACRLYLADGDLANLWLGGAMVGGVVHLILAGETQPEPFRFILATVIWLGAATVAFGIVRSGYGMAVAMLGGASALVLFGNVRGLMTISVAASILIYRLFREIYPDEAKALDIGQHYTMIGIAIGALLPLLPIEWARGKHLLGSRALAAISLWLVILIGLPVAASILLGSKGAIGMVVGLSFAAVIEGLRGVVSLAPVGIAMGLGTLTVLSYEWLGDWTDLERGVKIRAVIAVSVVALILAAALFGISRNQAPQHAEAAPEKP